MTVRVVAAALLRTGSDGARQVLAARRSRPPALAGGWEFPGGKVEPGEGDAGRARARMPRGARRRRRGRGAAAASRRTAGSSWCCSAANVEGDAAGRLDDHDELRWLARRRARLASSGCPIDAALLPAGRRSLARREPDGHRCHEAITTDGRRDGVRGRTARGDGRASTATARGARRWYLRALNDELTTSRGRPCVVMAPRLRRHPRRRPAAVRRAVRRLRRRRPRLRLPRLRDVRRRRRARTSTTAGTARTTTRRSPGPGRARASTRPASRSGAARTPAGT